MRTRLLSVLLLLGLLGLVVSLYSPYATVKAGAAPETSATILKDWPVVAALPVVVTVTVSPGPIASPPTFGIGTVVPEAIAVKVAPATVDAVVAPATVKVTAGVTEAVPVTVTIKYISCI